jgi:hypothetical protein
MNWVAPSEKVAAFDPFTRRDFIKSLAFAAGAGLTAPLGLTGALAAGESPVSSVPPLEVIPGPILLDMVHNNPGEPPFVTHYNDPAFLKQLGYPAKVYELFESAQFGIDWSSVDPDVFATGSPERAWLDQKAAYLDQLYTVTKQAGLAVYCHTDMIVFPKKLVEKHQLTHFRQVSNPETQKYLRLAIQQMFRRFPQLDGLVVRIGETYLQGAPYHLGGIADKNSPEKTIIPLMNLLREEVCDRAGKKVFFRAWASFDTSLSAYQAVSDGVEPHPNLFISVKHCEGDFHRGNPFSKVLGVGRHLQVIEVQCQREYEGKGAYPNYIAHGVIEGFEEHHGESLRKIWSNPLIAGMFTWSRGGGWRGPYITNELWCDLNVYVLSHWVQNTKRSEVDIFNDYCTTVLKLSPADAATFRKLCLLSADAVYRGIRGTHNEISPWWTRDQYMGRPPLPEDPAIMPEFLQQKDAAVAMWQQMIADGDRIHFPDPAVQEYVNTSCQYGLHVYQIYRDGFKLAAFGANGDKLQLKKLIDDYDQTWAAYKKLKAEHPSCGTLYVDKGFTQQTGSPSVPGIGAMVDELRKIE